VKKVGVGGLDGSGIVSTEPVLKRILTRKRSTGRIEKKTESLASRLGNSQGEKVEGVAFIPCKREGLLENRAPKNRSGGKYTRGA